MWTGTEEKHKYKNIGIFLQTNTCLLFLSQMLHFGTNNLVEEKLTNIQMPLVHTVVWWCQFASLVLTCRHVWAKYCDKSIQKYFCQNYLPLYLLKYPFIWDKLCDLTKIQMSLVHCVNSFFQYCAGVGLLKSIFFALAEVRGKTKATPYWWSNVCTVIRPEDDHQHCPTSNVKQACLSHHQMAVWICFWFYLLNSRKMSTSSETAMLFIQLMS